MRRSYFLVLAFFTCLLWPASTKAGVARIALLEHSQVRGDSIFLSDFLPKNAPHTLWHAATKISLGVAPQYGSSRKISRTFIMATMNANGISPVDFVIPEVLTVQHAGHQVTREEVFAAVQQALAKNKSAEWPPFQLEDLSLDAAVFVPDDRPELEVTQITFDEFIGCARFRLWTRSAPEVHPFFATARTSTQSPILSSSLSATNTGVASVALRGSKSAQPILIESNRLARLHLHSANASMLLEVKTLQRGSLGDVIRVRLPGNGKTLLARVDGSGSLEAGF